jgi:hypothetical protein
MQFQPESPTASDSVVNAERPIRLFAINLRGVTANRMGMVGPILLLITALSACYFPNRERFEKEVDARVSVGMPLPGAIKRLAESHVGCDAATPAANGLLSCSRVRQRLWPSSCIERVDLTVSAADNTVRAIQVPPIRCAGL